MNKKELIEKLAISLNTSKAQTIRFLSALETTVSDALFTAGEVMLPGIGKITVTTRAARIGRNPATGKSIELPEKGVVKFRAASSLKNRVA
jgi:DNA-binding protein HU-beta